MLILSYVLFLSLTKGDGLGSSRGGCVSSQSDKHVVIAVYESQLTLGAGPGMTQCQTYHLYLNSRK